MKTPFLQYLSFISLLQLIIISVGGFNNIKVVAAAQGQCMSDQKILLLQLQSSLEFNSTASTKLASWNHSTGDCCDWPGVECDTSGHVITLILDNEAITGGLDESSPLFSLQYFQTLNLAFNRFISDIPVQIYNLTNLKYLNLSHANFGQVPNGISRLTRLVTLDLSIFDELDQTLTLENPNLKQFFKNSTQLRHIYLDGVDLSTRVPKFFSNFSNLKTLSLSGCNLHGEFPREIFLIQGLQELIVGYNENLRGRFPSFPENGSLRMISVADTQFSGSLPPSISNLSNLSWIDLNRCKLSGSIPSTMAQLKSLAYVDFSNNNFTGSIPHFLHSKNLTYINLSQNGLTGTLSSKHFEGLPKIVNIHLGSNFLFGRIPPSLFSLPSLQWLDLSNNSFDGLVDEYVNVSTSQLEILDLSHNRLNGSLPKYFFEFPNLSELLLSSNSLSGRIQSSLFSLPSLQTLDLFNNSFDGLVDEYVNVSVSQLERLDLSFNRLKGSIPEYFFELPKLIELYLSSNSLGGRIHFGSTNLRVLKMVSCGLQNFPDLRNQSNMMDLDLSDNEIGGEIPSWIWEVGNRNLNNLNLSHNFLDGLENPHTIPSGLSVLDLHSNQLKGQLPNREARYLDYSNNFFNGSIPFDLGSYASGSSFLSLSNNSFTGIIPESICNASYLMVLDLSNNKLSGNLPSCLFNTVGKLKVLNLGENQISGKIPNSFPRTCALQSLDLSKNSIHGRIPKSLIKCSSLEILNVGSNKIVDTFPCPLKKLSSLRVIVLESNGFYGEFHCANANHMWPNLQIIDVASNNFTGELSPKLLNWKGMASEEDHAESRRKISSDYLNFSGYNYQVKVTLTVKGKTTKFVRILTVLTSIDFSCNNFHGIIPDTIGGLTSLYFLNLSHNSLTGNIPKTIGNLKAIESLDLSANQLNGKIPAELAKLTFLSVLNLSFNRLSGVIPTGNQLNTFGPDSYLGNQDLRGFPLSKSCKSPPSSSDGQSQIEFGGGQSEIKWEYVTCALGFALGLGMYLWMLLHNKRCWEAYQNLDEVLIRLFGPRRRGKQSPRTGRRVRWN
ncbi:PREDICTED: receptor-like protein 12 [Ipomoea nil]|uniref:receptor-like protein 12 n=1 Tax=Ipomoea nil TaxID=35883 RepID=UPI000900F110|nr:PREDICTED: receptor-like protein 12 [Ipomoea nil]XP_019187056.1 PREDICTED: receptor-like protein 12 [Ipomoea nil]XP_019187057.1 PREDICTED: receptor-like protein 12 [Ipomoea nil]